MSETITLTGGAEVEIHGTNAAAILYVSAIYGPAADAWTALSANDQKKTLASAVRFLNAQTWTEDYDTFEERDAVAAFATAQYELAVLIADDPSVVSAADQGSNIASLGAGSASISFFNSTTKAAPLLPPVLMRLIGTYLAASDLAGPDGGESLSSCADNPFSRCEDSERDEPY